MPEAAAAWLAYIGVFAAITYLSLIAGELVPKNLALRHAETIACAVAPLMSALSRIAAPAVWLLDVSTKAVFWLVGQRQPPRSTVTEEEIKGLIAEAEGAGVLESGERRLISGVLRLGDRPVRGLMTPRTDVDWIDANADAADVKARVLASPHTRLPVGDGSPDDLIGVVRARELLVALLSDTPLDVRAHLRQAPIIPDTTDALDVLETLRDAEVPMALIHDEYGHFEGIVTPADVLEVIAGVFRSDVDIEEEPYAVPRDDGSWLLVGRHAGRRDGRAAGLPAAGQARLPDGGRLRAGRAAPHSRRGRVDGDAGLALRGGRPRRPPHRQGPGEPPPRQPAADRAVGVRRAEFPSSPNIGQRRSRPLSMPSCRTPPHGSVRFNP